MNSVYESNQNIVFVNILVFENLEYKILRVFGRSHKVIDVFRYFGIFDISDSEVDADTLILYVLENVKYLFDHRLGE